MNYNCSFSCRLCRKKNKEIIRIRLFQKKTISLISSLFFLQYLLDRLLVNDCLLISSFSSSSTSPKRAAELGVGAGRKKMNSAEYYYSPLVFSSPCSPSSRYISYNVAWGQLILPLRDTPIA